MTSRAENPMSTLRHKPHNRYVAASNGGVYLGDISGDELADMLEAYARAIRSGSRHAQVFPPQCEFGGVPCTFRRSNVPKLDPIEAVVEPK